MTLARRLLRGSNQLVFKAPGRRVVGAALLLGVTGAAPACAPAVTVTSGTGGASASSSTGLGGGSSVASTSGGGGIAVSTSATGTGGAGGAPAAAASVSSSSGGGGMASASTTASSSASVGGAGGASASGSGTAASSSTSSSAAASSSSSSGAGGGAPDPLDCALAGFNGGDLVWTHGISPPVPLIPVWQAPGTPKYWHLENVFAGSTGHVFVAASGFGFTMYGISGGAADLDELDSKGAYLGTRTIYNGGGGGLDARTSVFGPRYHAFAISIPHSMGIRYDRLEGDAVSLQWQIVSSDVYGHLGFVTGNADGDLFASFSGATFGAPLTTWSFPWGVEDGNLVVKWNSAGGHVYTKNVAPSPSVLTPGNSGDAFLAGWFAPGDDLGCGPLAGPGPYYVARLDPTGQCLWSHAFPGAPNAGGSLAILGSATDGSAIVADSHFSGTTDIGCGPMTAAPGGSSFVARLDAAGACLWSKSFDVHDVTPSLFPSGDLLVSMPFTGKIDLGGGPLTSGGAQDVAVARLDGSSGAHVWSKSFGSAGVSLCPGQALHCNAVADANGSVVLSGALTGWVDFGGGPLGSMAAQTYAVKLDGKGAFLWHHAWPAQTFVVVDPCGAVLGASDVGAAIALDKLAP